MHLLCFTVDSLTEADPFVVITKCSEGMPPEEQRPVNNINHLLKEINHNAVRLQTALSHD